MTLQRGDIVLLDAPFASRAGSKPRPMLVVQKDLNNARMANTILVFITTNLAHAAEPTQVLVDVNTPEGRQSGLKQTSVVSCENILTVVQSDILERSGIFLAYSCKRSISH
jgi:mRNA interferase MazF